jgi:hypothetical protein
VTIFLDFHNKTASASPNIEAIYFYTGKRWAYKQDGQDCPQTKADFEDYELRHLIRPPLTRLTKNGWGQVKLVGEKVCYKWDGHEIKDSYKLSGKALVRVVTERETYDYPLNLEIEVSEMPF